MMIGKPDELRLMQKHLRPGVGGRGRHSTLYRWLFDHADAFHRLLTDSEPSWESVAEALAAHELLDGSGKPPTGDRARKTWYEVRRAKGWHLTGPSPPQIATAAPVSPAPPPSNPSPAVDSPPQADARARFRAQFVASTIRNNKG
jgi:hypothetical protein